MPGIVSAVDGTHIKVRHPDSVPGHSDWRNRKGYMSYNVMGVVDANSRFLFVNASWVGSVGDARVFANTWYGEAHADGTVYGGHKHSLPDGTQLSFCSVSDSAYPGGPCMQKPYADLGTLADPQLWYNFIQSVTRQPVERGFGRLKGRWRTLLEIAFYKRSFVPFVVVACMVLHNIAEDHAEAVDEALSPPADADDSVAPAAAAPVMGQHPHDARDDRAQAGHHRRNHCFVHGLRVRLRRNFRVALDYQLLLVHLLLLARAPRLRRLSALSLGRRAFVRLLRRRRALVRRRALLRSGLGRGAALVVRAVRLRLVGGQRHRRRRRRLSGSTH